MKLSAAITKIRTSETISINGGTTLNNIDPQYGVCVVENSENFLSFKAKIFLGIDKGRRVVLEYSWRV